MCVIDGSREYLGTSVMGIDITIVFSYGIGLETSMVQVS